MATGDQLTWDKVNHFVLGKQHLTPETKGRDLLQIAGDVGGLHATGVTTPYLSLFARVDGFQRDQLDRLLYEKPALAKIRCVRNTIYVHPSEALPFVFCATVRSVTQGSQRYMEARGISEEQFKALNENIVALLQAVEETVLEEIQDQAVTLGWFIFDQEPQLKQCGSMTPLTSRTAGSMMSPLKECDAVTI